MKYSMTQPSNCPHVLLHIHLNHLATVAHIHLCYIYEHCAKLLCYCSNYSCDRFVFGCFGSKIWWLLLLIFVFPRQVLSLTFHLPNTTQNSVSSELFKEKMQKMKCISLLVAFVVCV